MSERRLRLDIHITPFPASSTTIVLCARLPRTRSSWAFDDFIAKLRACSQMSHMGRSTRRWRLSVIWVCIGLGTRDWDGCRSTPGTFPGKVNGRRS